MQFCNWLTTAWNVDISPKIKAVGFQVVPKRWVVERTFAWFGNSRRLDKDLEKTISSQEAMIKISHFHTKTLVNTSSKILLPEIEYTKIQNDNAATISLRNDLVDAAASVFISGFRIGG